MKTLVACSVTALLCFFLLVLIPIALAQGSDYYCMGPFNNCPTVTCQTASGSCPDVPTVNYVALDLAQNQMVTACHEGMPKNCQYTQQANACTYTYWTVKSFSNMCSNSCGSSNMVQDVCQLP